MAPRPPVSNVKLKIIDPRDRKIVHVIDRWQSYRVTQGVRTLGNFEVVPADTDAVRKIFSGGSFQKQWYGGWVCEIEAYGARILSGLIDEPSDDVSTSASELRLTGREYSGLLQDSAIRPADFNIFGLSLKKIAEKWTQPHRAFIGQVITDFAAARYILQGGNRSRGRSALSINIAEATRRAEAASALGVVRNLAEGGILKVNGRPRRSARRARARFGKSSPEYRGIDQDQLQIKVEAGSKAWPLLAQYAKHIASHLWMTPEGDLVLARPQYSQGTDIYGRGLVLRWSDLEDKARGDSNVLACRLETTIANRHSEYLILGSGANKKTTLGRQLIRKSWSTKDPSPAFWERTDRGRLGDNRLYKPDTIKVKRLSDEKLVRRIARTRMEEAAINSIAYEFQAESHLAETGAMWAYDSMVRVYDERHGVEGAFWIEGRDFAYDLNGGEQTTLKLKPPGVWLALDHDAIPSDSEYEATMVPRVWW